MIDEVLTTGILEKPNPFMVRQAHHERNVLIYITPFAFMPCGY
jgi:hypothetical protein